MKLPFSQAGASIIPQTSRSRMPCEFQATFLPNIAHKEARACLLPCTAALNPMPCLPPHVRHTHVVPVRGRTFPCTPVPPSPPTILSTGLGRLWTGSGPFFGTTAPCTDFTRMECLVVSHRSTDGQRISGGNRFPLERRKPGLGGSMAPENGTEVTDDMQC